MIPYLLVSRSAEYESRLRGLLGDRLAVVAGEYLTFGTSAVVGRVEGTPRVVFLGPVLNYEETRGLVEELTAKYPDVGLIVVREQRSDLEDWVDELSLHAVLSPNASEETTLELVDRLSAWLVANGKALASDFDVTLVDEADGSLEALLGIGRDDLVASAPAGSQLSEFTETVDAGFNGFTQSEGRGVDELTQPQAPEWEFPPLDAGTPSEAIAVVAPKGGQGKTTLAINLATGLAEVAPNSVVLIDADLQFGDITVALGLAPQRTIVDAVAHTAIDDLVLKTALTHHDDGFFVVASAPSPELGDSIPASALARLIEQLRSIFRYVVVDTTPGLSEHTLVALEHVTDAVFVTNMSVASIRAMRTELELLRTLGLMPGNRHIVVNQTDRSSGLTIRDVENIVGAPVDVDVPRSSAVLLASNRGVPLIHDDVRDPAAKAIRSLVMRIAPDEYPKRGKVHRRRRVDEPQ